MKLLITAGEILDRGHWDEFCELKGINVWAMNEGLMDSDEEFRLSMQEVRKIGLHWAVNRALEQAKKELEGCSCSNDIGYHGCPYQSAIKANDDSSYCNCCDHCTTQCQYNV